MRSKTVLAIILTLVSTSFSNAQQNRDQLDKNKHVVAAFYREVINNKKVDSIGNYITDDFVLNGLKKGVEGQSLEIKALFIGFSDLVNTIEISFAEEDLVCVHENWTGKHTGDFMGVPASGKNVMWMSTVIFKIRDGKIAAAWGVSDYLGLFQKIGAYPKL